MDGCTYPACHTCEAGTCRFLFWDHRIDLERFIVSSRSFRVTVVGGSARAYVFRTVDVFEGVLFAQLAYDVLGHY